MKSLKFTLAIYIISLALNVHAASAQNSPQDLVNAHNLARAEVGVLPIIWNETLAELARNISIGWIIDCNLAGFYTIEYGENIAEASYAFTGEEAVKLWANEKPYYDYDKNECVGRNCLHYTQVVWNESINVGCVRAQCYSGYWFVSCNYYPVGNMPLERPYKRH